MYSVKKLKPHPKNPRIHPDSMIAKLCESIKTFGFKAPIIATTDNIILAGHGRIKAAKYLKIKKVPVMFVKMSPEKALAYCLADNKISELSKWDDAMLGNVFRELHDKSFDLTLMGFDIEDLSMMDIDNFERPKLEELSQEELDQIKSDSKSKNKKNGNWLYVEYYTDNVKYRKLVEKLISLNIIQSKSSHDLNPDIFYDIIMGV